jgi:hypothetical protein
LAAAEKPRSPSTIRAIALLPADYGVLAVTFALWGWPPLFLAAYTLLLAANILIGGLLLITWFRGLSRPATP